MLKLHFFNVGDGDSILLEYLGPTPYRVLIDAGRFDVTPTPQSLRRPCWEHLASLGVSTLDAVVITHLHIDHFGGLRDLMDHVQIKSVYSGFFPEPGAIQIPTEGWNSKSETGLAKCMNRWMRDCRLLREAGVPLVPVRETVTLNTPQGLTLEVIAPNPRISAMQDAVWTALCGGRRDVGLSYEAAKARNPGSLRVRAEYAGRRIELSGDCYGEQWEAAAAPADIWKVPHHADAKSVTEETVRRVHPSLAVISCGMEYIPRKDRPSGKVHSWLQSVGAEIHYTDAFAPADAPAEQHTEFFAAITPDGRIQTEL